MIRTLLVTLALATLAPAALAHTALKTSTPASGSVLSETPAEVTLTFKEPTRLISVQLVAPKSERRLTFSPRGQATAFTIAAPNLAQGRNELRWRAISQDGHPVEGSVLLVVRAPRT